jgi:hypothetical protein
VDGDITVEWTAATGTAESPIRYRIYVAIGAVSAASLFVSQNAGFVVESQTQARLFTLGDGQTVFTEGQQYTFGVRAVSSVGVSEENVQVITIVSQSTGNPTEILQNLVIRLEASTNSLLGGVEANIETTEVFMEVLDEEEI